MMGQCIVVVEDDDFIATLLQRLLRDEGFKVLVAQTLKRAMITVATSKPDLIILDLGLPDGDATELIESYRVNNRTPIIVVSARTDDSMKVQALDCGADDYLTKPFSAEELLARIRVQLRRRSLLENRGTETEVHFGDFIYSPVKRILSKHGEVVHLTKTELKLLEVLLSAQGRVLTQSALLAAVWGEGYLSRPHYLRIYINRLRQKIERDPTMPQHLFTEIGVGYRFSV